MNSEALSIHPIEAQQVVDFWFIALKPEQWWKRDEKIDADIVSRFSSLYEELLNEVPEAWLASPYGCLAAVIVLDQFPRNMFRDDARTFATDASALEISGQTISVGDDIKLDHLERAVLYMPYMHSEDGKAQERSIELFESLGYATQLDFAIKHKQIIDRFGRFPHRNKMLGRDSTPEEVEFLNQPGLFW
jgi:uncharacterized protein (DUF924 family)